jgi:hypothetical protein
MKKHTDVITLPEELLSFHGLAHNRTIKKNKKIIKSNVNKIGSNSYEKNLNLHDLLLSIINRKSLADMFTGKAVECGILIECLRDAIISINTLESKSFLGDIIFPKLSFYCMALNVLGCVNGLYQYNTEENSLYLMFASKNS